MHVINKFTDDPDPGRNTQEPLDLRVVVALVQQITAGETYMPNLAIMLTRPTHNANAISQGKIAQGLCRICEGDVYRLRAMEASGELRPLLLQILRGNHHVSSDPDESVLFEAPAADQPIPGWRSRFEQRIRGVLRRIGIG